MMCGKLYILNGNGSDHLINFITNCKLFLTHYQTANCKPQASNKQI